jgi:hypothetical protein
LLGAEFTKVYANTHGSKQGAPVSEGKSRVVVRLFAVRITWDRNQAVIADRVFAPLGLHDFKLSSNSPKTRTQAAALVGAEEAGRPGGSGLYSFVNSNVARRGSFLRDCVG